MLPHSTGFKKTKLCEVSNLLTIHHQTSNFAFYPKMVALWRKCQNCRNVTLVLLILTLSLLQLISLHGTTKYFDQSRNLLPVMVTERFLPWSMTSPLVPTLKQITWDSTFLPYLF